MRALAAAIATLIVACGAASSTRPNDAPGVVYLNMTDGGTNRYPTCPGPLCTIAGVAGFSASGYDADGDAITLDVEVVPAGAPFTGAPTVSVTGPGGGTYQDLLVQTPGLVPGTEYRFDVRARDVAGAWATISTPGYGANAPSASGWTAPAGGMPFVQGPCDAAARCPCVPIDGGCRTGLDCCSGRCAGPISAAIAGSCY